ncbi:MAG: CPBP family intramembrane glutamic endopeptidase [Mycobacteriales bacterium]
MSAPDGPSRRAAGLGAGAVVCLAVIALAPSDAVVAGAAVVLVFLSCRSSFDWVPRLPLPEGAARIARRVLRSLVYLPAVPFLPRPPLTAPWWGWLAGLAVGAGLVASQWKEVRRWLQPAYLRVFPPLSRVDRARDLIHFSVGGGCQEYLYRHAVIVGFAPLLGWGVVPLSAALFVLEHLAQGGSAWDRKDLTVQSVLGGALALLVQAGGGWLPAVLAHTLYNAPSVVFTARRPSAARAVPS